MAYDIYWDKVVLGMHMDDTGLTDVKGHAVTLSGDAARSATQSKFGGYSAYFDGTGDYLSLASSADFGFGTGDFTIEFFVNPSNLTGLHMLYDGRPGADGNYVLIYTNGTTLNFHQNSTARITGGTLSTGTFFHVAACRTGTTTTLYLNGTSVGTWVDSTNYAATSVRIGADNISAGNPFAGYIDELRVVKGSARYTANFTPPTAAFGDRLPAISGVVRDSANNLAQRAVRAHERSSGAVLGTTLSNATTGAYSIDVQTDKELYAIAFDATSYDIYWNNVVLAMHMDDTGLTDLKGHAVTLNGNAARSATQSKFGSYSAYFDGTGDYLSTPGTTDLELGGGDFTIEFWLYLNSATGQSTVLAHRAINTSNGPIALFRPTGTSDLKLYLSTGTSSWDILSGATVATAIGTATWRHIAICRNGSSFLAFVDGTMSTIGTSSAAIGSSSVAWTIGADSDANSTNGYIDDLRVTKGIARYTASFTPPTTAFIDGFSGGTENAVILDRLVPA